MKKESLIVIFYVLYFSWLFTVTYLTQYIDTLNYFSVFVVMFYFVFLRERDDLFWFIIGISISVLLSVFPGFKYSPSNFRILFLSNYWMHLTWGTTVLALRKLIYIVYGRGETL